MPIFRAQCSEEFVIHKKTLSRRVKNNSYGIDAYYVTSAAKLYVPNLMTAVPSILLNS